MVGIFHRADVSERRKIRFQDVDGGAGESGHAAVRCSEVRSAGSGEKAVAEEGGRGEMRADRNCRYPRLLPVVAALIMLAAAAAAQNPDATYAELVKKAQAGDSSVDFRALRLACADAKKCDATDRDDLVAMRKASQAKDYKKAAKLAEKSIERGFPNIEAHATAAEAYKALKETDKAEFHHAITGALIRSIMKTGDGKTKETAF